ncbi:MAG: tetratricopeptide repeat protein, partial [Terriglobia bacterium]
PNFLFRNNRDGTFDDVTRQTGLDRNNNRFSFACGWCDYDANGWPDLYVANDFGKKNLYHNNGDGAFTDVAEEAGVLDTGAGMSVCWLDYDNDGKQDLYVADMWTAAGQRLTHLDSFMPNTPRDVRDLYRKHSMGNSLFRNDGKFQNESAMSGAGMGRWAWSSDAWDFDHDGFPDLYIANGMISGPETSELSSFFWRQVVARSPLGGVPTDAYEQGWNAINELIRSDATWSGYERNVLYANNRDGTFSEVSGAAGLDLIDDSRSFALADIDHDGRLEIILKNRTAPQVRVFHNVMPGLGHSLSFKLKGSKSNKDAIGASITLRAASGKQTKFLQAGSGFLAQHSKEVFFGVGQSSESVHVTLRWPNGLVEGFENVPVNHRIEIEEGAGRFKATPYSNGPKTASRIVPAASGQASFAAPFNQRERASQAHRLRYREELPRAVETWLLAPIDPPGFSLPDLSGQTHSLSGYRGRSVLLNFWSRSSPSSVRDLRRLQGHDSIWRKHGITLLTVNVDHPSDETGVVALAKREALRFPILMATAETLSIYNLLYRYSFDRRRDLQFPISFLLDPEGMIVKIYQGQLDSRHVLSDAQKIPKTERDRQERGLPFRGGYYGGGFIRNYFTYGVTFAQHGYPEAAETAFKRAIQNEPESADAYYDLGTLYMQQQKWDLAREQLLKAAQLKPGDLMALNNLGVIAAREGRAEEAAGYLTRVLQSDPGNALALGNLADLRRAQGRLAEAEQLLEGALKSQPDNPGLNYKLGMVFASAGENAAAQKYLEKAVQLQPDYAEALDNLGVLYALTNQPTLAIAAFTECIERAPKFDQAYLNLARVQIKLGKPTEAAAVLRELLQEVPGHPLAEKYLRALGQ